LRIAEELDDVETTVLTVGPEDNQERTAEGAVDGGRPSTPRRTTRTALK